MSPGNAERRPRHRSGDHGVNAGSTTEQSVKPDDALFSVTRGEHALAFSTAANEARDAGVEIAEGGSDEWERSVIDQAISAAAARGKPFSQNLIRPLLPEVRPNVIGARFLAAARRGEIHRVGYVQATHAAGHCRPITLWAPGPSRGADVDA